jgi:hypothetical protein
MVPSLPRVLSAALVLAAPLAEAKIVHYQGDFEIDLTPGSYEASENIRGFNELQCVKLESALCVDWSPFNDKFDDRPGQRNGQARPGNGRQGGSKKSGDYLPSGIKVDSHYFYLKDDSLFGSTSAEATVVFDGPILGLVFNPGTLGYTDGMMGLDMAYPDGLLAGSSILTGDSVQLFNPPGSQGPGKEGAHMALNVKNIFGVGGFDSLRVITAAGDDCCPTTVIPEPSTWAFFGGFSLLSLLTIWQRRRKA